MGLPSENNLIEDIGLSEDNGCFSEEKDRVQAHLSSGIFISRRHLPKVYKSEQVGKLQRWDFKIQQGISLVSML